MTVENTKEALCPACREWSPVYWTDTLPPGGWWWETAGCPKCGHVSLVETECEVRKIAPAPRHTMRRVRA